jgi:hypothetical protein
LAKSQLCESSDTWHRYLYREQASSGARIAVSRPAHTHCYLFSGIMIKITGIFHIEHQCIFIDRARGRDQEKSYMDIVRELRHRKGQRVFQACHC